MCVALGQGLTLGLPCKDKMIGQAGQDAEVCVEGQCLLQGETSYRLGVL